MKYLFLHSGHHSNLTVYCSKREEFFVLELEKLFGIKHYNICRLFYRRNPSDEVIAEHVDKIIGAFYRWDIMEKDEWTVVNPDDRLRTFWKYIKNRLPDYKGIEIDEVLDSEKDGHHFAHAACGYFQSPFDDGIILTVDSGAYYTTFCLWEVLNGKITVVENYEPARRSNGKYPDERQPPYACVNHMFNDVAACLPLIASTTNNWDDCAGKLLGLSGYGDRESEIYKDFYNGGINLFSSFKKIHNYFPWWIVKLDAGKDIADYTGENPEIHSWMEDIANHENADMYSFQQQADIALAAQDKFCEIVIGLVKKYKDYIKMKGNNLVISGGASMNLFLNQRMRDELDCNVYVPPNPTDSGLSHGEALRYIHTVHADRPEIIPTKPPRLFHNYAGPYLSDDEHLDDYLDEYEHQKVDLKRVADILQEGAVIGFLQGRSEIGKRALGNRSLLAYAADSQCRERIDKIKRRESYRPYAPVCIKDEAPVYFDSPTFDNMDAMLFPVIVREEYRDTLSSIGHVDNSARLQTVEEWQNPVLYALLDHLDGARVLLNTSFNIGGKPTLNSFEEAFWMLDNTELDHVVYVDEDDCWVFYGKD